MSSDLKDFSGFAEESNLYNETPSSPQDELWHSVYIAGRTRVNTELGVTERPGMLQIRGVQCNLDKVCMIVLHTKSIQVKREFTADKKEKTTCFSYLEGPMPHKGTSGNTCGKNAAERAMNPFCKDCKNEVIIGGLYCECGGQPVKTEEGKPILIFLRGKGIKLGRVREYLSNLYNMEIDYIFPEADRILEKQIVNNKRFITEITIGQQDSNYGVKDVFALETGAKLPNKLIQDLLKVMKDTKDDFDKKFNWQKVGTPTASEGQSSLGSLAGVKPEAVSESVMDDIVF